MSESLDQEAALKLLRLFKKRTGQKHSWREVQRAMAKTGHKYVFLSSGQKLANWDNPDRQTPLQPEAFEAVKHFIRSPEFQKIVPEADQYLHKSQRSTEAGALITKLAGIYPLEKTEEVMFKALEGFWFDRQNDVSLYIYRVPKHNFCITHLHQKCFIGYGPPPFYYINRPFFKFFASGFLYFDNATHSRNARNVDKIPGDIGQVKERYFFKDERVVHDIHVSGKQLILKLWDLEKRNEANFKLSCESFFDDGLYEEGYDGSYFTSSHFNCMFQIEETTYQFYKANDPGGYFWTENSKKEMNNLKKEFYNMKWNVLPNDTN